MQAQLPGEKEREHQPKLTQEIYPAAHVKEQRPCTGIIQQFHAFLLHSDHLSTTVQAYSGCGQQAVGKRVRNKRSSKYVVLTQLILFIFFNSNKQAWPFLFQQLPTASKLS